jgi:tyrosyl-tRNA synthetase
MQETIGLQELEEKIASGENLNLYWGTAPTRMPSVAYFVPLLKLRDCINTGKVNVTIFLADLHSYMDKGFSNVSRVTERTNFYEFLLKEMMNVLGVSQDKYKIVRGSSVQKTPEYMENLLKFTTLINVRDAKHAGKEVVKQNEQPLLSSLIYPVMQCLDEKALSADVQLGGMDQRKIFTFGRDFMPKMGFRKCVYLMNPLIPSLVKGGKMSSSDSSGKLEFTDTREDLKEKIKRAFCVDKDVNLSTNPCLSLMKYVVFPIGTEECKRFGTYEEFERLWVAGDFNAQELKRILCNSIDAICEPIRRCLEMGTDGGRLYDLAYKFTNDF